MVTTHEVTEIGISSAICGGEVTDDGGAEVTARGVCWSTNPDPTITDAHTTDGSGTGSYTSNITELDAETVYYVRAYATNEVGTVYGKEKQFTTKEGAKVTTKDVTGITETTAICGGEVTDDGGAEVTAKGVCWSTNENPTIADSHTMNGSGLGSFTSNITGLAAGNTYYVRAYATTMDGTSYGIQKSFTTGIVHECVDLGLPSGLKWATCNVGANTPFGYGNYYAWGEIEPKESYTEENCLTLELEMEDISGETVFFYLLRVTLAGRGFMTLGAGTIGVLRRTRAVIRAHTTSASAVTATLQQVGTTATSVYPCVLFRIKSVVCCICLIYLSGGIKSV